jgi:HEAT repeat protein
MGCVGGPQAIKALMLLLSHDDLNTRADAAAALGEIGTDASESVPLLQSAIADKRDPDKFFLRLEATTALGKIGTAARIAKPDLLHSADDPNEDAEIRAAAVLSLGSICPADEDVLHLLQGYLKGDTVVESDLLLAAVTSLGQARRNAASAVPQMVALLNEPYADEDLRAAAARSLGLIGQTSPEVVATLMRALDEEPDLLNEDLRPAAASALGKLHATAAIDLLRRVSAATNEDESIRKAAAAAAATIQSHH